MNISEYWKEKAEITQNAYNGWQEDEKKQIAKLVIATMLNIPHNRISYYLNRDSWLLEFALGDAGVIDADFATEESTMRKVNTILETYFYKVDYEMLCEIKQETCNKKDVSRKDVCGCLKELVDRDIHSEFTLKQQNILNTYEKIYFDSLELLNGYVEEMIGFDSYCNILVEQWKTANEMAANISEQRNNMNNFYMSLMSILVGGILFSNQMEGMDKITQTILYAVVLVIGTVCCQKWIRQIDNYARLNGAKYDVINELERNLPANVMLYEYLRTEQNARRKNIKISFSKQEKEIARLFQMVIAAVPIFLLISLWGDTVWKLIQNL